MKKILALCLMLLGLSSSLYANPFTSVMGKVFSKSITKSAQKTVGKQAGKLAVKKVVDLTGKEIAKSTTKKAITKNAVPQLFKKEAIERAKKETWKNILAGGAVITAIYATHRVTEPIHKTSKQIENCPDIAKNFINKVAEAISNICHDPLLTLAIFLGIVLLFKTGVFGAMFRTLMGLTRKTAPIGKESNRPIPVEVEVIDSTTVR